MILIMVNLGDVKIMIIYLVIMIYGCLFLEDKQVVGIIENLIWILVGIEVVEDFKVDLNCGFQDFQNLSNGNV